MVVMFFLTPGLISCSGGGGGGDNGGGEPGSVCTDLDDDGYALEGGDCGDVDCNDDDVAVNPGAAELCDGIDNDCDGLKDEGGVCDSSCTDLDGDGYALEGGDCGDVDCNDNNIVVNPGAVEVCDEVDNDCDGTVDEGCLAPTSSKLTDTGQTESYTDTFGEDHDYTFNPPDFTRNTDGTVNDNITGLIWQLEDDNIVKTWDDASTYCAALTLAVYDDWRLPTKKELMRIVDYGVFDPAIDPAAFRGTDTALYWSETISAGDTIFAWGVNFDGGNVIGSLKSDNNYVRCVRDGP